MIRTRCTWCGNTATGRVKAKDDKSRPVDIPYCDTGDTCWDKTHQAVRRYTPRTWTRLEQSPPDLFDLLPPEGKIT